jgi:predicted SAM-dependent methyltransferase
MRMHEKGVRSAKKLSSQRNLKLHIGCGPRSKPGWVNIDLHPNADMTLDMREPLPFLSGQCQVIYSEHFLEHIDYPDPLYSFLRECYRVLQPGGLFSVGVPDTEPGLKEYCGVTHDGLFEIAKQRWHPKEMSNTRMEQLNFHFRQGNEHRMAYDYETLAFALTSVGFQRVARREFNEALDSLDRKLGTLYVDGVKP